MSDEQKRSGVQLLAPDEWWEKRGVVALLRKWLNEHQTTSVQMDMEDLVDLVQQAYDKFGIIADTGEKAKRTQAALGHMTSGERRTYQSLVARGVDPDDAIEGALDGVDVHDVRDEFRKKKEEGK